MAMASSTSASTVKTRILIISDTHAKVLSPGHFGPEEPLLNNYRYPYGQADVAIHCGDLTLHTHVVEYQRALALLHSLNAPLKLVIPGNHDCILDTEWGEDIAGSSKKQKLAEWRAETHTMFAQAEMAGIKYLHEGVHQFDLANGARFRVFASPYTPKFGYWGFQYIPGTHRFDIPQDVDLAVTHGPPQGVLDRTARRGELAGCPNLFHAVSAAAPKVHCFGHIHEAWGAELVTWRRNAAEPVMGRTRATMVDEEKTEVIESLNYLNSLPLAEAEPARAKLKRDKFAFVDLSSGGEHAITPGQQTLFVNAAFLDLRYQPTNVPWLVDLDLPRVGDN